MQRLYLREGSAVVCAGFGDTGVNTLPVLIPDLWTVHLCQIGTWKANVTLTTYGITGNLDTGRIQALNEWNK